MGEEELRSYLLEVGELCAQATPVGFEPTRGDPMGLAGQRLKRSAKVSCAEREQVLVGKKALRLD